MKLWDVLFWIGLLVLAVYVGKAISQNYENSFHMLGNGTKIWLSPEQIYIYEENRTITLSDDCLIFRDFYLKKEVVPRLFIVSCEKR